MKDINDFIIEKLHLKKGMTVNSETFIIMFSSPISSPKESQGYKIFDTIDEVIKYIHDNKKGWTLAAKLTLNQVDDFVKHYYEDYTNVLKDYCHDNNIKLITKDVVDILKKKYYHKK